MHRLRHRRGQGTTIHLSIRREREFVERHNRRRHHIIRHHVSQGPSKRLRIATAPFSRHHIGHQPLVSRCIFPHDDHRLLHRRIVRQDRLDFSEFDPEPA